MQRALESVVLTFQNPSAVVEAWEERGARVRAGLQVAAHTVRVCPLATLEVQEAPYLLTR